VLAEVRRAIVTGDLKPGEQIVQDALAEQYGVSRVPLREALKILEGEGQVTYKPHKGYFVTELSTADLEEVYRLRELLEGEAIRVGIPRLTDEDLHRIAEAAEECEAASAAMDIVGLTAANRRFHFELIESSEMPRLTRLVSVLWDSTDVYRSLYYGDSAHRATVIEEHRAIVAAARARDADEVVRLLQEHREHAIEGVRAVLD